MTNQESTSELIILFVEDKAKNNPVMDLTMFFASHVRTYIEKCKCNNDY